MRIRSTLLAAATLVPALVAPTLLATAGHAATYVVKPWLTCDSTTNTVSSGFFGERFYSANTPVTVRFKITGGGYVNAAGYHVNEAIGTTQTVSATTDAAGGLSVSGYSRTVPLSADRFFTETAIITVLNATGGTITERTLTCSADLRTTVRLTCDSESHTITVDTAGVDYLGDTSVKVWYTASTTSQATANEPGFTSHNTSPPDVSHQVAVTDGQWSDVGYTKAVASDPYYLAETVEVVVWAVFSDGVYARYVIVGRGAAACVYSDHRV